MNIINRPDLIIAQYNSDDWETLILDYTKALKASGEYDASIKLGGSGDGGRDVVAFCSEDRYEGVWDNYQCKFYSSSIGINEVLKETGKLIHQVSTKNFTMPRTIYFVARSGFKRAAQDFLDHPSKLRPRLISDWDDIIASEKTPKIPKLSCDLHRLVEKGVLPRVTYRSIDSVLETLKKTSFYAERFGGIPPDYIKIPLPLTPAEKENRYIRAALDAYEDRRKQQFQCLDSLNKDSELKEHIHDQRELFYEAESFQRTYMENSPIEAVSEIQEQIFAGVKPIERDISHIDALSRLDAVVATAGTLSTTGLLAPRAKVNVKQGFCHHLANMNRLCWRKK